VSVALAACASCVAGVAETTVNHDGASGPLMYNATDGGQAPQQMYQNGEYEPGGKGVLPFNAPWDARQAYYNGSWAGFDPMSWQTMDPSGMFCPCMCSQNNMPKNYTGKQPYFNYTLGFLPPNFTDWQQQFNPGWGPPYNHTARFKYTSEFNYTGMGEGNMPGGYGGPDFSNDDDDPWVKEGSNWTTVPHGYSPLSGSYGVSCRASVDG
jgi:hypothetical protein